MAIGKFSKMLDAADHALNKIKKIIQAFLNT